MAATNQTNNFAAKLGRIHELLGFQKRYNFILFVNFAGALMGFTLARLMYLNFDKVFCGPGFSTTERALPGECYYYRNFTVDRIGIIMHLACILPASFLVCWQFVPAIRRKWIIFHRINGYVILTLSVPGTIGALMLVRHAVGGGLEVQAAVGFLCLGFLGSLLISIIQIKRLQIEQHRAWMLRAWFYAGAIITMRPILLLAALIISKQGGYYVSLPCAVIEHMLRAASVNNTAAATSFLFEGCTPYTSGKNPNQQVPIEANFFDRSTPAPATASLHASFGMAGWLAGAIHAIGVEVYLRLTPKEAERLRHMSYQRQLEAGMRNPGSAGLTLDRLGVEDKWEPKDSGRRDGDGGNSQDSGNSCLETGSTEKQPQGYAERSIM
ncbi:hypothetical protein CGCSCA4_v013355 [Colletotrichum siamense]|uniref:Microtubule associated protein n=1 Tax=Colletotrichum siamense TaxID=690259 RepID=A0A9P5BVH1_COLSI|nr:hypothetical protein CGCSCA4_v013355 [Colletotrichum siamense]KAF4846304.1 hypothetical protein CGCSCA2_v013178 [Colletotrichum siamense]